MTAPAITRIDYFVSLVSPFAYLGHAALHDMARRTGGAVVVRPVRIAEVFAFGGAVPLAKRAPARQRYRLLELQRWRKHRGLPLHLAPAHFPADATLADCCTIALLAAGADPDAFMRAAFRALWAEDRDIADTDTLGELLTATGHDAAALLTEARSADSVATYQVNTDDAVSAGLPGLPGYVFHGEPFWGQDRIDLLEAAITSGRPPYRAD